MKAISNENKINLVGLSDDKLIYIYKKMIIRNINIFWSEVNEENQNTHKHMLYYTTKNQMEKSVYKKNIINIHIKEVFWL